MMHTAEACRERRWMRAFLCVVVDDPMEFRFDHEFVNYWNGEHYTEYPNRMGEDPGVTYVCFSSRRVQR